MKLSFINKSLTVSKDTLNLIPYFQVRLKDCWDGEKEDLNIERLSDGFEIIIAHITNPKYIKLAYEQFSANKWTWLLEEFLFYGIILNEMEEKCSCHSFEPINKYTDFNIPVIDPRHIMNLPVKKNRALKIHHKITDNIQKNIDTQSSIKQKLVQNVSYFSRNQSKLYAHFRLNKFQNKIEDMTLAIKLDKRQSERWRETEKISDFVSQILFVGIVGSIYSTKAVQYYDLLSELEHPLNRRFNSEIVQECGQLFIKFNLSESGIFISEILYDVYLEIEFGLNVEEKDIELKLLADVRILDCEEKLKIRKICDEGGMDLTSDYIYQTVNYTKIDSIIVEPQTDVLCQFFIKVTNSEGYQIPLNTVTIFNKESVTTQVYSEHGLIIKRNMKERGMYIFDNNIYHDFISEENQSFKGRFILDLDINTTQYPLPYIVDIVWIWTKVICYQKGQLFRMYI